MTRTGSAIARRLARLPGHDQLWGQEWAQRQG